LIDLVVKEWRFEDIVIKVDYDKCIGHRDCAEVCPVDVYDIVEGKSVAARIEDCTECCACVERPG
jgi:NAD-dependent dihydropyrimidine dehydrogenase PreA subunit